jgi:hypothetical protein
MNERTDFIVGKLKEPERSVKRRRLKAKKNVVQLTKKPLSVRYAEVLRLRQALLQTQSAVKPSRLDRPGSE